VEVNFLENPIPETTPSLEPPIPPEEHKRPAWLGILWEIVQTLIMAVVLYFLIDTVVGRVRVENISMQPTLHEGEFILVNKLAYRLGSVERGDIVIFHHDATDDYIKRVIGLPGDKVEVRGEQVYINGHMLSEKYIAASPRYTGAWEVPEGQLFVLGDNRNQSFDSHNWGFVPLDRVVGRALVVYWPLKDIQVLNQVPGVAAAN
jgi:signal peptidase I